jgi:hypothetical protein
MNHVYILILFKCFMDQFKITISMVNYLYVIIIMLIYGIKIIRKMPIFLTNNAETWTLRLLDDKWRITLD